MPVPVRLRVCAQVALRQRGRLLGLAASLLLPLLLLLALALALRALRLRLPPPPHHPIAASSRPAAVAAALAAARDNPAEADVLDDEDEASLDLNAAAPLPGARIFAPGTAALLRRAAAQRTFVATGFAFCPFLNGASFEASVTIPPLGGSVAQVNPPQFAFVELIDARAWRIYRDILHLSRYEYHREPSPDELRRLACYFAAEGNSAYANLTRQRLLVDVDPQPYFRDRIRAIVPRQSPIPGPRRKYLIAYLIMVHEVNGFMQLEKLLNALDDGDAIILIHVDARPKSEQLRSLVDTWVSNRAASSGRPTNVFLAKNRFCNIWGHASLVLTQLSGFWELLDMADWDYVINLSNYDYPLRRNKDMHAVLSQKKYRDKNFIEYWPQTDDLAERFYRAHIGEADFSSLFHPSVLGITSWSYPRWNALKHHQWMIITPAFVRFLRQNRKALNFLAFAEHTYIPDEAYFATVLLNVAEFRDKVVNNNKRYLRFAGSDAAHPSWLGYPDRFLFPANEPEPSFFFIRKLNVLGNVFQEDKLLHWIEQNHRDAPALPGHNQSRPCTIEDASVRIECLREYGAKFINGHNEIVVVPVNRAFLMLAANLRCSLRFVNIVNVVYWSLDLEVHESLLKKGRLSIFLPGFPSTNEAQSPRTPYFNRMMRFKPKVLAMLLEAGLNVWYMDADVVALEDFRPAVVQDRSADVFLAVDNVKRVTARTTLATGDRGKSGSSSTTSAPVTLPHPSGSIMYLRQGPAALAFIRMVMDTLEESVLLNDQDAMRRVLVNRRDVAATYEPAAPKSRVLGSGNVAGAEAKADADAMAKLTESAAKSVANAAKIEAAAAAAAEDASKSSNQNNNNDDQSVDMLERAAGKDAAIITTDNANVKAKRSLNTNTTTSSQQHTDKTPIHVKFLDQFEHLNGIILFTNTREIPVSHDNIKTVHLRQVENPVAVLGDWGLWFTDSRGACVSDASGVRGKLYEQIGVRAGWRS